MWLLHFEHQMKLSESHTQAQLNRGSLNTYKTCPLKLCWISSAVWACALWFLSEWPQQVEYLMSLCKRVVCKCSDSSQTFVTNNTFNTAFWTYKTFQHLLFFEEVVRKHSDTTFQVFSLVLKLKVRLKIMWFNTSLSTRGSPHIEPVTSAQCYGLPLG